MKEILEALQSGEEKQAAMNTELNELRTTLLAHESLISSLTNRVAALEVSQQSWSTQTKLDEAGEIKYEISVLKAANTDVSNRMRRNNLLFLGLDDSDKETWAESETKILLFCSNQLDIKLGPTGIERAHRLGKFTADKKRPIIVELAHFKTKESILACGHKLRETKYAVREDFAFATRLARSKLVKFIRPKNCAFKLSVDKVHAGHKCYVYKLAKIV